MTRNDDQTVRSLLPDSYRKIDEGMRREFDAAPEFAQQKLPGFLWKVIGDKATEAVHGTLELNLFGVFARAWCKGLEIRRFAKESLGRPGVPVTLCLGKHQATTSLQPEVEVSVSPFGTHRVPFELVLSAEFDSAELTLFDGAIVSVGAGVCRVTAQMKLGGQPLHDAKKSPPLELSNPYVLEPKLPVVAARQADLI